MSLLKQTWRFLGACAIFALAPVAKAQDFLPLAGPMEFDPDWQWFAPIDVDELAENSIRKRGKYGWFVNHDRMRLWVTRPDGPSSYAGDWSPGQRTDLGFVREDGAGWSFTYSKVTMSASHPIFTERINRVNTDDPTGGVSDADELVFPELDRNDPFLLARAYMVRDSLNMGSLNNFEINKTWRRSPYRYGGILEPLVGLKYANFTDLTQDQNYSRSIDLITEPGATTTETQLETLTSWETVNINRMLGGQFGARYFNDYRRWRFGMEAKAFLAANFRTVTETRNSFITEYGGAPDIDVDVVATQHLSTLNYNTSQSTVWGFEVKGDAAYQVTKYIGLRGGFQVIDLARGIRRGGVGILGTRTPGRDQNVFMAGLTFGLEINR